MVIFEDLWYILKKKKIVLFANGNFYNFLITYGILKRKEVVLFGIDNFYIVLRTYGILKRKEVVLFGNGNFYNFYIYIKWNSSYIGTDFREHLEFQVLFAGIPAFYFIFDLEFQP